MYCPCKVAAMLQNCLTAQIEQVHARSARSSPRRSGALEKGKKSAWPASVGPVLLCSSSFYSIVLFSVSLFYLYCCLLWRLHVDPASGRRGGGAAQFVEQQAATIRASESAPCQARPQASGRQWQPRRSRDKTSWPLAPSTTARRGLRCWGEAEGEE